MRVCSVPGCPTIHDLPGSRCPAHEIAAKQQHWAKTKAYSSKGHRSFRAAVLGTSPICVLCPAQATVADHYPRSRADLIEAGENPDDPRHGRSLCKSCHDRETATNQPGGWNNRQ